MSTPAPHFFMSYSREDANLQRRIIAELRGRGINVWVDVEHLIPGSPAWEKEIESSIRSAAGVIVLLSPDSNDSEWVRREISFAEQNDKRIFPVLVSGEEDDSIPLRLSSHQRVDLRSNFEAGLDELANALRDHLGVTIIRKGTKKSTGKAVSINPADLKKFALPALIATIGVLCIGMVALAARFIYSAYNAGNDSRTPTATFATDLNTPPDTDPVTTPTAVVIDQNLNEPAGKIVYTCQVQGDEICMINADGSNWRRLTNSNTVNYYGSLSTDGESVIFISKDTGNTEIYEIQLGTGKIEQLTQLKADLGAPEISPDEKFITFTYRAKNKLAQIWIMNRDGGNPHELYSSSSQDAHDATWSPDGKQILFAMGKGENNKLYIMDFNEHDPQLLNDTIDTRGRSDWSHNDLIIFDMGGPFQHDVYLMNTEGLHLTKFSNGDNSQGASFSPDGQWIAFTAYTDVENKNQGSCEIYIVRVDGSDRRRLTENNYCDYQPRWGN